MILFQSRSSIFESLGLLTVLMVVSAVQGSTSKAATANNHHQEQNKNFISIPIKSHHALEKERRSLLSLRGGGYDNNNSGGENRRYRHRDLQAASATAVSVEDGVPQQMVGLFQGYGTFYIG